MNPRNQSTAPSFRSTTTPPVKPGRVLRRLAIIAAFACIGLYLAGAIAGYVWLRYSRGIENVGFFQVAFVRVESIKHAIAAKQLVDAKKAWDEKKYQEAYVNYVSAVRRDPANVAGRLEAVRFFASMGAVSLEVNLLQEGLVLTPDDRQLNENLFALLLSLGRHRQALDLLHGILAPGLAAGPNAILLQTAELQATLAVSGAAAAQTLLARHPALLSEPNASAVVTQVLWQAGEKDRAVEILQRYIQTNPGVAGAYLELAGWQRDLGRLDDAVKTAMAACKKFPADPGPRVLLLDIGASRIFGTPDWTREVAIYLRDFAGRPEAIMRLAELAGRHGWVDLTHTLYEMGAMRHTNLGALALYYEDALLRQGRLDDARQILTEVELQAGGSSSVFQQQLRQRQIALAAVTNDRDGVREYSRKLASLVRNDPDVLGQYRQFYQKIGLADAVAELGDTKTARPAPKPAAKGV
jgi:tetratricopeptide (TPR) repeat protein